MANITYPDVDRLTFWGVPYQFDYVFGPGTQQAQASIEELRMSIMMFERSAIETTIIIAARLVFYFKCLVQFPTAPLVV